MLRIELLSRGHNREGFTCGEGDLDDYLKRTARQHNDKGIARTFVLVDSAEPEEILGFFTLTSCEVVAVELPPEYARKYLRKAPAAKLARLAVARDRPRRGFGGLMMVDAMRRTLSVAENIGSIAFSWMRRTRAPAHIMSSMASSPCPTIRSPSFCRWPRWLQRWKPLALSERLSFPTRLVPRLSDGRQQVLHHRTTA